MFRRFIFAFSKTLNKENYELYNKLSQKIESQPFKMSVKDLAKLSQQNLVDIEVWQKAEIQLNKWLNHIDNDDLTRFSILISKYPNFLSMKAKLQYENRIRKLSKQFTERQVPTLIATIFPIASESIKSLLIQIMHNQKSMSLQNELKCLLVILQNSKSVSQIIIDKLKQISLISDFGNYEEITLFLQLYYSNIIKDWYEFASQRDEMKQNLNEVIYGNKTNQSKKLYEEIDTTLQLKDILIQLDQLPNDDSYSFKRFLAFIQFVRACKYKNCDIKVNLADLFTKNYQKLTPNELLQIISEFEIEKQVYVDCLLNYIKNNELKLNNNYYIMFQTANLKYLQSQQLSDLIISNIKFTIESLNINDLPIVNQLLLDTLNIVEKDFKEIVNYKINQTNSILIKTIQINNSININNALKITKYFILQNDQIQILWDKVLIEDINQVQTALFVLRYYVNKKLISSESLQQIQQILRNKFQITQK